jgi:rare lipoprotein A
VIRRSTSDKSTTAPSGSTTNNAVPPISQSPSTSATRKPGAYYKDDGPDDRIPEGLLDTPDAEPRIEPYAKGPSRPYTIFDQTYVPITDNRPFVQRGIGSWYGKKFHGQRTASGEIYDMYKMTAAHPTLPIPCYARVTNLRNGKQVIVRINDRGPFHSSRIIDLSYTAALKLGYVQNGSSELEVERLLPEEITRMQAARRSDGSLAAKPATADEIDAIVRPVTAPTTSAVAVEAGGFFLQFGVFSQVQNAASLRERLLSTWPEDLPRPEVVQSQGLYRLHSGPFNTREMADRAAQALKSASQLQPTIVQK